PPGHRGFLDEGALSDDGTLLAGFVSATDPSSGLARGQLVVIDLGTMTPTTVPGSVVRVGDPMGIAVWTPDGAQVIFCGGGAGSMFAYHPGDPGPVQLNVPCSYNFVVF
ncbi:MAG TPA: hypothetical protein VFT74_14270, partial [Isosphaeraceae bacterium]|nr:hypothetical protein [Isosphaeraceae bacterium]